MRNSALVSLLAFALLPAAASGVDVQGTVSFQGQVLPNVPIPGIDMTDLTVSVDDATEATGNGVRCSILSSTSDGVGSSGPGSDTYPNGGAVSAEILMERGGPQMPSGACLVTLRAAGWDGAGATAHGAVTLLVSAAEIDADATVTAPVLFVRPSKAAAGLATDCKKWAKKQMKLRDKCNARILEYGGAVALEKCKDRSLDEPLACDPGDHVEAALRLAHGGNDQQTDVASGEAVDTAALEDQVRCQALFGKAAVKFLAALAARVQAECVKTGEDSEACRDAQRNALKGKLDPIDDCNADAMADGATGRVVPEVGPPCFTCIPAGAVDKKCLKACFESELAELASGLVGDVPVCGDGILQNGEFCDDGNLVDGDCCSSLCGVENLGDQSCGVGACAATVPMCVAGEPNACVPGAPGSEGPMGDPSCSNGADDDCDGDSDAADANCQPECGNGIYEPPGETCDDGNLDPGDGCDPSCQLEP
jgi:cysteine-rich repeat protein